MSIEARNLVYKYSEGMSFEKTALDDVSFSIDDGEFIGLIGHTGSGKSTLVQILVGLLNPVSGTVIIDGTDIFKEKNIKEARKKIGLVFQYPEHQLFETTVFKDVAFGPKNQGLDKEEVIRRVTDALDIVNIPADLYDRSPFELSGGQKRRIAIAGVLSMNPSTIILDEPTAGLDPRGKKQIMEQILSLKGKRTIILISHIMDDIARFSDRVIVLQKGKIALTGTPKEIFADNEMLVRLGLRTTRCSDILMLIRSRGFDVDICNFTPEDAADEIFRSLR